MSAGLVMIAQEKGIHLVNYYSWEGWLNYYSYQSPKQKSY